MCFTEGNNTSFKREDTDPSCSTPIEIKSQEKEKNNTVKYVNYTCNLYLLLLNASMNILEVKKKLKRNGKALQNK